MEKLLPFFLLIFFKIFFFICGKPKTTLAMQETISLYKKGRFSKLFAQIRAWDAPLEEIEKLVPKKGLIADLGCGDGLLANYLAITSMSRKIIGIELHKKRIEIARKSIKNVGFYQGDVLKENFPMVDSILLIHLLHHLPSPSAQNNLLDKCANHLNRGGSIIIVEIDKKPFIKYLLSWLVDAILFPILFEKRIFTLDFFYRDKRGWENIFTQLGLKFKTHPASSGKPFSHVIFECWK